MDHKLPPPPHTHPQFGKKSNKSSDFVGGGFSYYSHTSKTIKATYVNSPDISVQTVPIVEQHQCGQFSTLCGTSAGFHGFCTHAEMEPAASPLICSADDQLCPGTGCTCCLGCIEKDCSSKGEGWGCYSEKDAASFPQGSCLFDGSCARTPGSPLGECGCCKKEVDPTPCVQSTECKYSFSGQVGLGGQNGVRQRLTQLGLRGFCGDRSWRGGDCFTNGPDGRSVCPRLTPMDAKACTCCKECLDTSCSSKGKQWSCFSKAEASLLPEGACVFDDSCPRTPNSPYLDSSCACCNPEYIPPCNQTERCKEAFPGSGLKGFCSNGQQGPTFHCLPGDGIGLSFCNFTGCSCCKECMDRTCSKREGWSCYSKDEAVALPQGSCVFDDSCAKSPGSPYSGTCACCKNDVTTPAPPCDTTDQCETAYPGTGLRGFCGKQSLLGGDCSASDQPGGKLLCEREGCTCCKECLDEKCSAKGEGWSCYNRESAAALPEGSCVFDRSCSSAPGSPYQDSRCACCKPPEVPIPCQDDGCSSEWSGLGACVNVSSADWADVDANFDLSVPGLPGKCGPESCCVCLQKKKPCADQGCSRFFGGAGVCLNVLDPEFAKTSPFLDFEAGGRGELCAGCCTCFKKKSP